jgi:hypothetical protein
LVSHSRDGDAFGNASKVLEDRNDGKRIHVKCIPMHWPLDNVPGECTFECCLEPEASAVHARCRLINHRPDHTQYPAVGKLSEIRDYVHAHANRPKPPVYRFDKDRQGWTYVNTSDAGWPVSGELSITLDQHDPQLIGPVGFWQASDASTLAIEAASHTSRTEARVFWRNFGDADQFDPKKMVQFSISSDGTYHTYRVKLSAHPQWKGSIVQLRFDPVGDNAAGEWIRIKSISLEK